jgi:hypothetical protein
VCVHHEMQEFGLNTTIGPINVTALGGVLSGGDELAALLGQSRGEGGSLGLLVQREVKVGACLPVPLHVHVPCALCVILLAHNLRSSM